ncbi:MAG: tRNA guanosine(34) transglycosylase Tgt [Anaerolineae bacterium]|nr:tRNA guanosine(34) transglycosylase Tgt [Chloroflexota bacterium]
MTDPSLPTVPLGAFEVLARDPGGSARRARLHTAHGTVQTPVFCPVGTLATVKSLTPRDLVEQGVQMILSNTYHLYLRPGAELIQELGGLHRFMAWQGPILTDSGGFQVFSLPGLRKVDQDGVTFRSHIDGSEHRFTPEKVISIQEMLGSDIAMVLDECARPDDRSYIEQAMVRTHAWAERCKRAHRREDQLLYGIVQGGIFDDLRAASAQAITGLDMDGYAIGGLSVGESKADMLRVLDGVVPLLPVDKPRYLMGVGAPEDLVEGVARGIDIFDCVLPSRLGRNGAVFTREGRINLRNARFRDDPAPIEENCTCYTCRNFGRAYLRHLILSQEILAAHLNTLHNVHFLVGLMSEIRRALEQGTFQELRASFWECYHVADQCARQRNHALYQSAAAKSARGNPQGVERE